MTAGRAAAAAPPHPSAPRRPFGRHPVHLLLAPTLLFLLVFFGYPIARLLSLSFFDPDFTWKYYTVALTAPVYLAVLRTTIDISLQTTLLCLILGYPLAYALATASERARNLVIIAVVLPYFTSILVRSYAWLVILGRHGLLNEAMVSMGLIDHPIRMIYNTTGVVIGMSHIMLPIMVLALYSVMRGIDLDLMKVSESLGANRVQSFLRIYFPLSLPGIGAGVLLVFIFSVGFYVTPALLGGLRDTMLSMLIATQIQELLRWGFAGALSLILLVVTLCLFLVFNRLMGLDRIWGGDVIRERRTARLSALPGAAHLRRAWSAIGAAMLTLVEEVALAAVRILRSPLTVWRRAARPGVGGTSRLGIRIVAGAIVVFLLAPIVIIFPVSFTNSLYLKFPPDGFSLQWYRLLVETSYWTDSLWLSLRVAPMSMVLAVALGTCGAVALARGRFPLKEAAFSFILSPIIVPVIVTAVALYYFYSRLGLVGSYWGLVIGHTVGSIPVVVVIVAAALKGFDITLEQAAMSLGASPLRAFAQVTLPIIRPAVVVSAFFAFIHSFDEVVIASFVGGAANATLPVRMWVDVRQDIKPTLAAVSSLLIVFTIVILLLAHWVQGRRGRQLSGKPT